MKDIKDENTRLTWKTLIIKTHGREVEGITMLECEVYKLCAVSLSLKATKTEKEKKYRNLAIITYSRNKTIKAPNNITG